MGIPRSLVGWVALSAGVHAAVLVLSPDRERLDASSRLSVPIRATLQGVLPPDFEGPDSLASVGAIEPTHWTDSAKVPASKLDAAVDAARADGRYQTPAAPSLQRLVLRPARHRGLAAATRMRAALAVPGKAQAAKRREAAPPALTAPGSAGGHSSADYAALLALLHAEISKHKRYPTSARRQRREGTATVAFSLHPNGALEGVDLLRSSGHGTLDDAALAAVHRVTFVSAAGEHLDAARRFTVNVSFTLQE